MEYFSRFIEEYEKLKALYPDLYLNINESRRGNFWRIKIYAHELALIGDAELLTVEADTKEEAFERAREKMVIIPTQITEAIAIKASGRKVEPKKKQSAAVKKEGENNENG